MKERACSAGSRGARHRLGGHYAGGGWKSTRMPLQYAEKINAARSGMARAAEKAGRDSVTE